jgi:hypothetical protein
MKKIREIVDEKKTLPLFGRCNIVEDEVLGGGECYKIGDNVYVHPAKQNRTCSIVEMEINNGLMITPFACGSEGCDWLDRNCGNCKKENNCQLNERLHIAYFDDGKIPFKTAKRIGYTTLAVQRLGIFVDLDNCKEKEI